MNKEEKELLKFFENRDICALFEKSVSYLAERNALFKERESLYNRLYKIKDYLKQVHEEQQHGILSSYYLIWENITRLCEGKELVKRCDEECTKKNNG